ncbi:MAG: copper resistance protein CopC [Chloroflexi bacterium]|nr:copper resistance protein CopC [Chloroflexota bacterium]
MNRIRRRLLTALLVLTWSVLLLPAGTAEAHAFLVRTTPEAGQRLEKSPASLRLQFSEPVVNERVTVQTAGGTPIVAGPLQRLNGGLVVQAPLPRLAEGVYVVSWQENSADDGHLSLGEFAFAVGASGALPLTVSQVATPVSGPAVAVTWLFLGTLLLAFGGLVSERVVWQAVERRHMLTVPHLPIRPLLALSFVGGVAQLLLLLHPAVNASARAGNLDTGIVALTSRAGILEAAQLVLVGYGFWLVAPPWPRTRFLALTPLAGALVAVALQGHPATAAAWWAAPANALHLLAVALWLGGLAHVVLVVWRLPSDGRPALEAGVRRYAGLALALVGLAILTGLADALALFQQPAELLTTSYGRVLLIKALIIATTLGLALYARRGALPKLAKSPLALLRRVTLLEGACLLAAGVVAVVLAATAPPRPATATQSLLGPPPLPEPVLTEAGMAGWLTVYLSAAPGQLRVRVLAPGGDPAPTTHLDIAGQGPDRKAFDVSPRLCGPGCATTAFPWQPGATTLMVDVAATGWTGGVATFRVAWPLQPDDPALLKQVIAKMRAQPRVDFTERVTPSTNGASTTTVALTGQEFVAQEIYAAGGASDIRPVPAPVGRQVLTLFISGSNIWYRLEIDAQDRLERETIVDPGHVIERTFTYDHPVTAGGRAA